MLRFRGHHGRDAGPLDAGQRAQLDRGRGDGGAGVSRADDRLGVAVFHQIHRAADGGILFSPDRIDGAVVISTTWVAWTISMRRSLQPMLLQFRLDPRRVADEEELVDLRDTRAAP